MFGIGIGEFILVLIVALLVVGPDKLPKIAHQVAKAYNEFKRAGSELRKTVTDLDLNGHVKEVKRKVLDAERTVLHAEGRESGGVGGGAGGGGTTGTGLKGAKDDPVKGAAEKKPAGGENAAVGGQEQAPEQTDAKGRSGDG